MTVKIKNIHIGGDGHPDKWYLIVWGEPSTRESMEELKDLILSKQDFKTNIEIVEKIKNRIDYHKSYLKPKTSEIVIDELQLILDNIK